MKKITLILGMCLIFVLTGCQNSVTNTPAEIVNDEIKNEPAPAIANPASTNCLEKGGALEIKKNKNGEYGICFFEDNRQCEEWALLRGDCPVGGMKVTGYENEAQIFCAITGGQVEGVGTETPLCRRTDGTLCDIQANFDGECPDPSNPNPNAGNTETK